MNRDDQKNNLQKAASKEVDIETVLLILNRVDAVCRPKK